MICQRGLAAFGLVWVLTAAGQTPASKPKPNLNGIWEDVGTANWDLQDHAAQAGPFWQTGAIGAEPAGLGVVVGGEIPYLPAAAAKKKENFANRAKQDPEAKCYLPGIPRATYLPYPFQIVQSPKDILMVYEFASANRLINMGKPIEAGADSWMGTSNGHWEGNTLVVDTINFTNNGTGIRTPTDENYHLTERFTLRDANTLIYEFTVDDPTTLTKPWTASVPMTRSNQAMYEYACHEGNYGMMGIMTAARAEDKENAKNESK
jgi:hypothetical protein